MISPRELFVATSAAILFCSLVLTVVSHLLLRFHAQNEMKKAMRVPVHCPTCDQRLR